jgi:hypothetical protein
MLGRHDEGATVGEDDVSDVVDAGDRHAGDVDDGHCDARTVGVA